MITPVFFLAASLAAAQAPDKGYVVRADSATVWLDLTAADGAAPGRGFEVYTEGAELKHPVTGASLGRVQDVIASGAIRDVADKFSTGEVAARTGEIKAGQRARLTSAAPAPAAAARPAAARPGEPETRAPRTQGATLDFAATGMAVDDFDGIGAPQVALSGENLIRLYAYPVADAKPLAELQLKDTGVRILGLEAARPDGDKRATLFVSLYDEPFKRFETRVYKLEAGKWLKTAELPFLTRAYQDGAGARVLATQQISDDRSFPLGAIYPLEYKDGKYVQGRPAVRLPRVDWLYGFTTAQLGAGAPAALYYTTTHALRVQLGKKWWRTPDDDYGQTPIRVRWFDRLFEFNPPMAAAYDDKGAFTALFAVRNMAALGGLASPFGLFNRAELVRKRWDGLALQTDWRADLSGCAQALAIAEPAPGRRELVIALRGSADQSSVWTFDL